jgi:hypothetical protein
MPDQNPSKSTYPGAPGTVEVVFSHKAIAIQLAMLSAIGGAFVWFNSQVCTPRIDDARKERDEAIRQLQISNEQLAKALVLLETERQRNP